MFNINTPDPKEMAAIEARRNREKDRQNCFFNVQNRVMGVDVEALNHQVEERKLREAMERNKDMVYGTRNVHYDLVAQMLEKEEAERAYQLSKKRQEFRERQQWERQLWERQLWERQLWERQLWEQQLWEQQLWEQQLWEQQLWEQQLWERQLQQFKNGPVFDLWNPEQFQEFPTPWNNTGLYNGPYSMQCFLGEDPNRASYVRMQQEQLRCSLNRQLQEQQEIMSEKARTELLSEQLRLAMDKQAAELARLEEACRAAIRIATANANKAQAAKQAQKQPREHQQQEDANFREIKKELTSDQLTENPQSAQHPQASHQVLPCCRKRMTPKQQVAIRKTQAAQCQEKKEQPQAEKSLNAEWGNQTNKLAEAALKLEAQEKELCEEFQRGLRSFNQELAKEQQTQKKCMNSSIYKNQPTVPHYLKFNTSSH